VTFLVHDQLDNQRGTDGIIWGVAVVVSLLIHGALFVNRADDMSIALKPSDSEKIVTRVSFRIPVPPPERVVEVKPERPKPPPVKKRSKPKPKPLPKPKPKAKAKATPKPVEEEPPIEEEIEEEIQQAQTQTEQVVDRQQQETLQISRPVLAPHLVEQAKQSYLARLLAHIESHKHYPKAARRRHIEGEVNVSFKLLAEGQIDGLQVAGKRRLLQKATHSAVTASLPLPAPTQELDLPMEINFTMAFVLK